MPALKKTYFISTILLIALLLVLLLLGLHQYRLYGQHKKIIGDTERLILQYDIAREQIVENLINGNMERLNRQAGELEVIHEGCNQLLENVYIPDSYKLSFLQQIDLPGVMLLLRTAHEDQTDANMLQQINKSSRYIDERLRLFERLINGYIQKRLIGFQSMLIGILALIVASFIGLLFLSFRNVVWPISLLARRIKLEKDDNDILPHFGRWREFDIVISKLNTQRYLLNEKVELLERIMRLSSSYQQIMRSVKHCDNKEDFFAHLCKALMANTDYYLAWIGVQDREDGGLLPIAADGSRIMNGEQCREGMAVLLSAADALGWENDPSFQALQRKESIIKEDILANVPKGPFKETPLANNKVTSLSLPMLYDEHLFGVLTIYMVTRETVSEIEKAMLSNLSACLAEKIFFMETMKALGQSEGAGLNLAASDTVRWHFNAVLGEMTYGLAHEITDLNNGIINYAQLLSDELEEDTEHIKVLESIMRQGEKVADLVRPLLVEGATDAVGEGCRCIAESLDEVVSLMQSQLRNDGVVIVTNIPLQLRTRVDKKNLKALFLLLLNDLRKQDRRQDAVNQETKEIRITGTIAAQNNVKNLVLSLHVHNPAPRDLKDDEMLDSEILPGPFSADHELKTGFVTSMADAVGIGITGPTVENGDLLMKIYIPLL